MKLNQTLATETAIRKRSEDAFTKAYQDVQKVEQTTGLSRVYSPLKEDGDKLPPETKRVQIRAQDAIKSAKKALSELFAVTATKDATNCNAKADIVVDGVTVMKDVPATHLLFLEKRMISVIDFIKRLPVLSADESWTLDPAQGVYASSPVETVKTKKVEEYKVIVQATVQHPAQTAKLVTDENVGTWRTVKYSGGMTADEVSALLDKAEKMQRAIKVARQEANNTETVALDSTPVLTYVFG